MEDFDELDRALFALPLATPPADLRASILRATIYAEPAVAFAKSEIVVIGAAIALAVWFAAYTLSNPGFGSYVGTQIVALLHALAEGQTLTWLAAGAAVALVANAVNDGVLVRARNKHS